MEAGSVVFLLILHATTLSGRKNASHTRHANEKSSRPGSKRSKHHLQFVPETPQTRQPKNCTHKQASAAKKPSTHPLLDSTTWKTNGTVHAQLPHRLLAGVPRHAIEELDMAAQFLAAHKA
jgi:hypothetical protein